MSFNPHRIVTKIVKGDWLILPSGRSIQVCKVLGDNRPDVEVRYLDMDGTMATGSFTMRLEFLLSHARKLG